MSEFHTSKDAIDAYNNMEQIYGHTDDRCSKDADLIADDILDWLATINAATFDQSNQEILDRMLAQLDAATPSIDNCDVESSLKAFHKKYAMLFENATAEEFTSLPRTSPFPQKRSSVFHKVAFAATITILLCTIVTVQAFGLDVIGFIARWTSEIFHVQSENIPHAMVTKHPLGEGEEMTFDSLAAALDAFGVSAKLAPNQLPERFTLSNVNAINKSGGILIYADFESDDGFFQIRFKEASAFNPSNLEKENTNVTLYSYSGIDHYLLTDQGCQKVFWYNGEFECRMFGSVTEQEMEEVLKSIYD